MSFWSPAVGRKRPHVYFCTTNAQNGRQNPHKDATSCRVHAHTPCALCVLTTRAPRAYTRAPHTQKRTSLATPPTFPYTHITQCLLLQPRLQVLAFCAHAVVMLAAVDQPASRHGRMGAHGPLPLRSTDVWLHSVVQVRLLHIFLFLRKGDLYFVLRNKGIVTDVRGEGSLILTRGIGQKRFPQTLDWLRGKALRGGKEGHM